MAVPRLLCPLSPTIDAAFGEDFTVGDEGRGEGAGARDMAPSPHPLPRNTSPCGMRSIVGERGQTGDRHVANAPNSHKCQVIDNR